MSALAYLLLMAFPALLAVAAAYDLLTMTIPNRLSLLLVAGFPVAAVVAGFDLPLIGWHLLAGFGVLAVGFGMFAMGWVGGGDVKFAAATALWLGPGMPLLEWGTTSAIFGGVLTLALLGGRSVPLPLMLARHHWIARLHAPETGVPYGVALGAAGLIVYPTAEMFQRLAA